MRKSSIFLFCLILGLTIVVDLGCMKCSQTVGKKVAEKAIEQASGGKTKVDLGGSGAVDISGLPEKLRYPGAHAIGHWSASDQTGKGSVYVLETGDAASAVTSYYKKTLADWKSQMAMESENGTVLGFESADKKQTAVVTIGFDKTKQKTTISVTFATKD